MKALITGGLGFIGSNLAHRLVKEGFSVKILDACLEPYGWNFANIAEIKDKIEFIKGDIRDFSLMCHIVQDCDIIFDCAGQVSHLISIKDPFLDVDINVRGGLNVLEAIRRNNPGARVVYAGTRGVVGKMVYSPVDEAHPLNPVDIQGINKLCVEKYYLLYHRLYGMKTTSIRINNTYGPRCQIKHQDYGIVNYFIRQALLNEQIIINGPGTQTRDYTYIDDVVDALFLASTNEKAIGEVFNIGSGKETRFIDMVNLIIKIAGSNMKVQHREWPEERRQIEIGNFVVSYEKINKLLGWEPKIQLEEGIEKTVLFYKERIREYI